MLAESRDPLATRDAVDALRRRDRTVLEAVYRYHYRALYRVFRYGFSVRSGGSAHQVRGQWDDFEIEDLIQETYRKAFATKALESYDGVRPYRSWLIQIGRNVALDKLRKRTEYLFRDDTDTSWLDTADANAVFVNEGRTDDNPARSQEERELLTLVEQFVNRLSSRDQEVFDLRFRRQLSLQQATAVSELTVSQLRWSERRIRKELLGFLRNGGYLERLTPEVQQALTVLLLHITAAGGAS